MAILYIRSSSHECHSAGTTLLTGFNRFKLAGYPRLQRHSERVAPVELGQGIATDYILPRYSRTISMNSLNPKSFACLSRAWSCK